MATTISCVPVQTIPVGLEGSQLLVTSSGHCILLKAASSSISSSSTSSTSSTTSSSSSSSSSKTVAQQMQALRPLKKQQQQQQKGKEEPPALRCKRRVDLSQLGYSLSKPQPGAVARRNERERNRVKQVNRGFDTLRQHVPAGRKNKKMSKVETLRCAVDYIRELHTLLHEEGVEPTPFLAPSTPLSPQDSLGSCPSPSTHCSSPSDTCLSPGGSYDSSGESFPSPTTGAPSPSAWEGRADHPDMEASHLVSQRVDVAGLGQINPFQPASEVMDSLRSALAALHPTFDALDESFDDLDACDSSGSAMEDEVDSLESLSPTVQELRPSEEAFSPDFSAMSAFQCLASQMDQAAPVEELKALTNSPSPSMTFSTAPVDSFPPMQPMQAVPPLQPKQEPQSCDDNARVSSDSQTSPMSLVPSSRGFVTLETLQPASPTLQDCGSSGVFEAPADSTGTAFGTVEDLALLEAARSESVDLAVERLTATMLAGNLHPELAGLTPPAGQGYLEPDTPSPPVQSPSPPGGSEDAMTLAEDVLEFSRWITEQLRIPGHPPLSQNSQRPEAALLSSRDR